MDVEDMEGCADYILMRAGYDWVDAPDPWRLCEGMGVLVLRGAPSGCGGMLVANDPPTIYLRHGRDAIITAGRLFHELAHLSLVRTGIHERHDERVVDAIAARILIPSGFVRVECLSRGLRLDELPSRITLAKREITRARGLEALGIGVEEQAA